MNKLDEGISLAKSGLLSEAIDILHQALLEDPRNPEILYNLGMCFTDTDQPDKAIKALEKSSEYDPSYSNTYVALGYAYQKLSDAESAKQYFLKALTLAPDNSYAMRNLGGMLGKSGRYEEAISYFRKSLDIDPSDPRTIYGLAYSCHQFNMLDEADKHYRMLLRDNIPSEIKELAKTGLREIAVTHFKSKGIRMDSVMYMLSALQLFNNESTQRIREITFEIGLKGRSGFDINNPDVKYSIRSLPGSFSGLQLVSYMYVGFEIIDHTQNIGIDLSHEYELAKQLFEFE